MNLRVQHEDGRIETITLDDWCRVQDGHQLNRLVMPNGRELFFTRDGYYDGWGQALAAAGKE